MKKYEITNRKKLVGKLRRRSGFYIDSEIEPGVIYAIEGGEVGVINLGLNLICRMTIGEFRERIQGVRNRYAREEVEGIAELAEWKTRWER